MLVPPSAVGPTKSCSATTPLSFQLDGSPHISELEKVHYRGRSPASPFRSEVLRQVAAGEAEVLYVAEASKGEMLGNE